MHSGQREHNQTRGVAQVVLPTSSCTMSGLQVLQKATYGLPTTHTTFMQTYNSWLPLETYSTMNMNIIVNAIFTVSANTTHVNIASFFIYFITHFLSFFPCTSFFFFFPALWARVCGSGKPLRVDLLWSLCTPYSFVCQV